MKPETHKKLLKMRKSQIDYTKENERRKEAVNRADDFIKDDLLADGMEDGYDRQNKESLIEKSLESSTH